MLKKSIFIPKLHIKYAYPLDVGRRKLFAEKKLGPYPSEEEVESRVAEIKKLWAKLNENDQAIKSLIEITGVTLPRDLELCIFGDGLNAMSHPLIMPISRSGNKLTDSEILETIVHELSHRFVGSSENHPGIPAYWKQIRQEYKKESPLTRNHIIIYAILDKVLPALGLGQQSPKPKHPDYARAQELVREKTADALIKQFKSYLK